MSSEVAPIAPNCSAGTYEQEKGPNSCATQNTAQLQSKTCERKQVDGREVQLAVSKFFEVFSWVVIVYGCCGILIFGSVGLFVRLSVTEEGQFVINGISPHPSMSLVGFVTIALIFLVTCILCCWLRVMRRKAFSLVDELTTTSGSEKELQDKMAKILLSKLNSDQGRWYRDLLFAVGIGQQKYIYFKTPPDQIHDALLHLFDANVCARLTFMLLNIQYQLMSTFLLTLIESPGLAAMVHFGIADVYWAAMSSVLVAMALATFVFLYLQWLKWFTVSFSCLNAGMALNLMIQWKSAGPSAPSFFCFFGACSAYISFLCGCFVYLRYIKPGFAALFNLTLEYVCITCWASHGLERDSEHLEARLAEMKKANGFLFRRLMDFFFPGISEFFEIQFERIVSDISQGFLV